MDKISEKSSHSQGVIRKNLKGIALSCLQSLFYCLQFIVIKYTKSQNLASVAQIQIASSTSLFLLGVYKLHTNDSFADFRKISYNFDTLAMLMRATAQALTVFFSYISVSQLRVNSFTSILYLYPIFGALLSSLITNEAITSENVYKSIINFGGVLLITRPFSISEDDSYIGFLNATIGMLLWAVMPVTSNLSQKAFDIGVVYFISGIINVCLNYFLLLPFESKHDLSFWSYVCFLALGVFRCLGVICFDALCKCSDLVVVLPFEYVIFVYTLSFDFFLFGVSVGRWDVLGVLLILVANFYPLAKMMWNKKNDEGFL